MLDEGVYTSVSGIGEAEGIDKGYVSRILRLALLAPDIKPKTASLFVSRLNLGHPRGVTNLASVRDRLNS